MLTKEVIEEKFRQHELMKPRLETLRLAAEINPAFKNPHIVGGYLRNIVLDLPPRDCDVVFQGSERDQLGILEAVQQAEKELGLEPYTEWDFENTTATGFSGDFYEDTIGKYSYHTDYLTLLLMDSNGKLYMSDNKTLEDLASRVYDLRFAGVEIWAKHRGQGRSYASCLIGDLLRGMYLCHSLNLKPSAIAEFLMSHFDDIFSKLEPEDQEARRKYWLKKTGGDLKYQEILDRYSITLF